MAHQGFAALAKVPLLRAIAICSFLCDLHDDPAMRNVAVQVEPASPVFSRTSGSRTDWPIVLAVSSMALPARFTARSSVVWVAGSSAGGLSVDTRS